MGEMIGRFILEIMGLYMKKYCRDATLQWIIKEID